MAKSYHVGFDIARYLGRFEGRKWEGFPTLEDEEDNVHGTWYRFEPAETEPESLGKGGVRFSSADFAPKRPDSGEEKHSVLKIPAPAEEIQETFDACRRRYHEWLDNLPEERYF